jgi:hypothetical protein
VAKGAPDDASDGEPGDGGFGEFFARGGELLGGERDAARGEGGLGGGDELGG